MPASRRSARLSFCLRFIVARFIMSTSSSESECKDTETSPASYRKKRTYLSANEKIMTLNIYNKELESNCVNTIEEIVKITARIVGVSERTVYRIRKEYKSGGISPPKKTKARPKIYEKVDNADKLAITRIVRTFLYRGELPTINKVLEAVNADPTLPTFKRSSFHKLLKNINFIVTKY